MIRASLCCLLLSSPAFAQIAFEPNVGQAAADIRYIATDGSYRLDLSSASSRLVLKNADGAATVQLSLVGANPAARWQHSEPQVTRANYFRGRTPAEWHTNIPTFGRVTEKDLYPGIDLVYHGTAGSLEYDFVVAPHADPSRIRMHYQGAKSVSLAPSGSLVVRTANGTVTQQTPVLFQMAGSQRQLVPGRFRLSAAGEISFEIGLYDRTRALTIDPTISFASYLGGTGAEEGDGIAVDPSGNVYLVGSTSSGSSDSDFLLRKFSPSGAQLYRADFGGDGDDFGYAIRVDSTGSVYIGGRTSSDNFPMANAFQPKRAGNADAFLLRVDPSGSNLVFSTYIGSSADDFVRGIAIDRQGAVYATGTTGGAFPSGAGFYQTVNRGGLDAFVIKLDGQGNGVYSTLLGGGSDDEGRGIAVDSNGVAYVTGTTLSDSFPQIATIYQNSRHGGVDAFVTAVNAGGTNLIYSTFLGGALSDQGYAIAVDSSSAVYVAGKTASPDFPTTSASYQKNYAGGDNDIFVAKFLPGKADVQYVTYVGSGGSDEGFGLAVDATGAVYITGDTDSDRYPVTSDATQSRRNGNRDAVLTKLNPAGSSLLFSTYIGGSLNEIGYGVDVDSAGNAYVTGITSSTDFPVTQGAFQARAGGDSDAFFMKFLFGSTSGLPTISAGGIVNGASFGPGAVAPGSLISIFGSNFIASPAGAIGLPLPTNLSGVSVTVNGTLARLFYVSPTQINAQVPYSTGSGTATLQINAPNGSSSTAQFQVVQAAPAIYITATGNRALAFDPGFNLITPQAPARVGSTVILYFTGVGPVNGTVGDGTASPAATSSLANFATIGGVTAPAPYIGLAPGFVGVGQANLVVPNLSPGDYPVQINIGGVNSNSALIAVR